MSVDSQYRDLRSTLATVEWHLAYSHRPTRRHYREWWVSGFAVLAVIALHALLMTPLLLGTTAKAKRVPEERGMGSAAIVASAEMAPSLMLISLSSVSVQERGSLAELASRGIAIPNPTLLVASPNPDLLFDVTEEEQEEQDSETQEAAGLSEHQAAMFGRYMGQVSARIDRAWIKPRSAVDAKRFQCQTRIQQDKAGNVLSIELHECDGDAHWQRSLVAAIERSSPLSAPPEPSVFAPTLVLNFSAEPYVEGVSNESEYEPKPSLVAAAATSSQPIANDGVALESLKDFPGAINVTITGNTTTWILEGESKGNSEAPSDSLPSSEQ